ncbi:MAG TPA: response regulator [Candidatus Polarisedimenticolia bacterium]|jgi:DNA-binding response OmpR family regulator|nr:response regulator [Candidatus Polarisedimenticolia bacterium]
MAGRILVADDSASIREVLQMNLETLGYEVLVAADGDQAMEKIYRDKPDLLILDVMMPKQNGFQVCRKVKTDPLHGDTPVILLTAKSQREDVYWGKDCGADEYVTKPFSAKELEGLVERLLSRRVGVRAPSSGSLEDEMERRRAAGEQGAFCILRWEARSMDVFRKKYGEVKYAESLETLRREAESFVDAETQDGRVEFVDTYGFRILLSGEQDEIEDLSEELCKRLSRLARSFYAPTDRERKGIEIRDFKTGTVETVPVVSFTAEVSYFGS